MRIFDLFPSRTAAIHGGHVDVLFRYTIGGPEEIQKSFPPELLSLTMS